MCGTMLRDGDRFCASCGARRADPVCQSCGAELRPAAAFCSSCGVAVASPDGDVDAIGLPPSGRTTSERRLTSVLFADLVNYTALSEVRDTEDVRELLNAYFEVCKTVVRRYGGAIEKFIGDAVMAVWGVPTAHEDDAERAVRAALELVSEVVELGARLNIPALALRAGLVTGEVSTTVGAVDQGMVAGDPVNTAARIQAAAAPGEVWVDANTRALTAAAISYADVGEHALKGKAEPVRLFRAGSVVAGIGGLQRVDGLEAPLAGRERELRLVKELFHATEESGRARLVVLDGAAGIGKSRLAWELSKYLDGLSSDVMWHQGRCLSYGDGAAFWALMEAVRSRLSLVQEEAGVGPDQALDETLARFVPDAEERSWLRPRLASLLGEGGDFAREDLFAAWTRFFERVGAGNDVVVFVVDDAQYADDGFLSFVEHLLGTAKAPMFVLMLARPELMEAHPALGGRRATTIRLEPLGDGPMANLVDGLVQGLPDAARSELVLRAEGVPLYAVETVRALIDRDLVVPSGGRYVLRPGAELDLANLAAPASLHALISARLDVLTPDERRVVADASVLGLTFTRDGIELLCADVADLPAVLESLARKEIINTETDRFSAERGQYRFVQSMVRQVSYGVLSRRDRKARHLQVAEHLAAQTEQADELAVVIAQHLIDAIGVSGPADADVPELRRRAVELLTRAADRACSLGSYRDGLRLYRAALAEMDDPAAAAPVQEKAADAALNMADYQTALELAEAALHARDAAGDPIAAALAARLFAHATWQCGGLRDAADFLTGRYQQLLDIPDSRAAQLTILHTLSGAVAFLDPAAPDVERLTRAHLMLAEQFQDKAELSRSLNVLAAVESIVGSFHVGVALMNSAIALSREQQDWRSLVNAEGNMADALMAVRPRQALDHARAAITVARDHGLHASAEASTLNAMVIAWLLGEWTMLEGMITSFFDTSDQHDPASLAMIMTADLWRIDAGLPALVEQVSVSESDDPQDRAWSTHLALLRARQSGDAALAARYAADVFQQGTIDSVTRADVGVLWPWSFRAGLAAADVALARHLVDVAEALPTFGPRTALAVHLDLGRALLAAVEHGDPARIEAHFRSAVEGFEAYESPVYLGQASEEFGGWLVDQGRADEAERHLQRARDLYANLGAAAWLRRLDERLAVGRVR
ncbi:MAG TPA: adenylate/guanylate cyclase domain-containing protein [Nakamurella sp.]|nr:adenylate/guanylate cyclase domain-containing protein [Nakamurella sp.]